MQTPKYLLRSKDGERFHLKLIDSEGTTVVIARSFPTRMDCEATLQSMRDSSKCPERFERAETGNQRFYFHLVASDGEVVGTSPHFETESEREHAIAILLKFGAEAPLAETSEP